MKCFRSLALAVVAALPATALAQPPDPPAAEAGIQVSRRIDDSANATWSPRLTLNLSPLTAIEGVVDVRPSHVNDFGTRTKARGFSLHWRQQLAAGRKWQLFGVLGTGVSRIEQHFPDQIIQGRDGPEVFPAIDFIDTEPVVHLGPAVQIEVAKWLALRGDVRLTMGDNNGGLRGMVGAVLPLGRFRAGDRAAGSTPPLAAWQRVKPGREVWVTTSTGGLVHGEVSSYSGGNLTLRQRTGSVTVVLDDIQRVEGRDGLKNGVLIGGGAGAVAGGVLFTWAARAFCESDSCEIFDGAALILGGSIGATIGGLIGAMVDSAIPGRKTLFEKTGTRVVPVLSAGKKAVSIAIDWR